MNNLMIKRQFQLALNCLLWSLLFFNTAMSNARNHPTVPNALNDNEHKTGENHSRLAEDNMNPPVLVAPVNMTVNLGSGECERRISWTAVATDDTDPNPTVVQTGGPVSGSTFAAGVHTLTFETADVDGNTANYTVTITVVPVQNPVNVLTCNDVNIGVGPTCSATITPGQLLAGAGPYACFSTGYSVSVYTVDPRKFPNAKPIAGSPTVPGSYLGQMLFGVVKDLNSGNSCCSKFVIEDKQIPNLNCTNVTVKCDADLAPRNPQVPFPVPATAVITRNANGTYTVRNFDNCSDVTLTYSDRVAIKYPCGGPLQQVVERTWVAVDGNNNRTTCKQLISLERYTLAEVNCPKNYLPNPTAADLPALNCTGRGTVWQVIASGPYAGHPSPATTGFPTGIGCGEINATFTDLVQAKCPEGIQGGCWKVYRNWTILDWCSGSQKECTQIIEVVDTAGPVISGIANVTVSVDIDDCSVDWFAPVPTLTDACSSIMNYTVQSNELTIVYDATTQRYYAKDAYPGTYTVTYVGTDCCGNMTMRNIFVTVADLVPPVAICDEPGVISLTTKNTPLGPEFLPTAVPARVFDNGSYDNCNPTVYFKIIRMAELVGPDGFTYGNGFVGVSPNLACNNANGDDDALVAGVQSYFDDRFFACCEDAGKSIPVVLRVFDVDPGAGPVHPNRMTQGGDLYGRWNDCMINANIQSKLPPVITAPSNITVSCNYDINLAQLGDINDRTFGTVTLDPAEFDPALRKRIVVNDILCPAMNYPRYSTTFDPTKPANFKYALDWGIDGRAWDNCGVVNLSVDVIDERANCSLGQIRRVFKARDIDGREISAVQVIKVVNCRAFNITDVTCANANPNDNIKWPCDFNAACYGTGNFDPAVTGRPEIQNFEDGCGMIMIAQPEDTEFYDPANPTVIIKILRKWIVMDMCANKQWTYTQTINIMDQEPPTIDGLSNVTICSAINSDNNCRVQTSELTVTVNDNCTAVANIQVAWSLDYDRNGTADLTGTGTNANGNHPVGSHRITWTAKDESGRTSTYLQNITIQDCKAPTANLLNISRAFTVPATAVTVAASEFNNPAAGAGSFDNCTAAANLVYSFTDPSTGPVTASRSFSCADVTISNRVNLTVYVIDAQGNSFGRSVTLTLTDCPASAPGIAGNISTLFGDPLVDATLELEGGANEIAATAVDGNFSLNDLTAGENYTVTARKDDDPLNGVSTLDLVMISKHILGIKRITDPMLLLAADVNNSGSVTGLDLVELRRLILGVTPALSHGKSWFFMPDNFQLSDPANPWATPIPSFVSVNDLQNDTRIDFTAIKYGDVNGSAITHLQSTATGRSLPLAAISLEDQELQEGQEWNIAVSLQGMDATSGWQWAFQMDPEAIQVLDWTPGTVTGLKETHFNLTETGKLVSSFDEANGVVLKGGQALLNIRVKALKAIRLSEAVKLASEFTHEAYDRSLNNHRIELNWSKASAQQFAVLQNVPNPFRQETVIGFQLPENGEAILEVFDATGRNVLTRKAAFIAGYNQWTLNASDLGTASGVLYYTLRSGTYQSTKRMILLD